MITGAEAQVADSTNLLFAQMAGAASTHDNDNTVLFAQMAGQPCWSTITPRLFVIFLSTPPSPVSRVASSGNDAVKHATYRVSYAIRP